MPIPTRTASVRSTTTTSNKKTPPSSRLARSTVSTQQSNVPSGESPKKGNATSPKDHDCSAASAKSSVNGSQASSRIPSPFKRNPSSLSSYTSQTNTSDVKPPPRGHVRQRSAALPALTQQTKFGHSRSISAVSNATSPSSSDASRIARRPRPNAADAAANPTKPKLVPEHRTASALSSRLHHSSSQNECAQNELLQLSVLHEQSSRSLPALQRSIDDSLTVKQANLSSRRQAIQQRKKDFSIAANLSAIDGWLQAKGTQGTCQSLQNLSITVRDLHSLEQIFDGDDGLAFTFEDWQRLMSRRNNSGGSVSGSGDPPLHIQYEQQLRPDLKRLQRQVAAAMAGLTNLPACSQDSSLFQMVQSNVALARSLISQCEVMLEVGEHLVSEYKQWLQRELDEALDDLESSGQMRPILPTFLS